MADTQSNPRLHVLLWVMLAWVSVILGRLVSLQVIHHDDLLRQAQQQQQRYVEIQAARGSILDRTGQQLAKSVPSESVCVNPQRIPDLSVAADLLSRVLEVDRRRLLDRLRSAAVHGSGFLWVKRKIAAEEAARLRSMKLDWVEFRPEMRRFYPHASLAAHVVGSMGYVDDTVEGGNSGVEQAFDADLAGRPGQARVYTDVKQNPYDSVVARKPDPGATLTLTIDPQLQFIAERELDKAIASSGAWTGSIVALNPHDGDVLAMANYPRFDPNLPPGPGEPENARSNLAVSTPFEPGSVFKVITVSAAFESTNLKPDTLINCGNGSIRLFGRVIHDTHAYSTLNVAGVLAHSSNIGAIQIALKVGERPLYNYQRKFGFGSKTGIDLPGESGGVLRRVEEWTPSSIGSLAMGHEVSVTALQLAVAGAAVANGGLLVKPRILLARQKPGEAQEKFAPEKPVRILAPETAIQMRQLLEGVVLKGTGKRAALRGYTSGGKTGSAQIYDLKQHVYTHTYNSSFLGFAPVTNPQIVIVVTLNGTSGGSAGFGGAVAAPVFREVAMPALRMLDVPKDLPDTLIRASQGAASASPSEESDLAIAGLGEPPAGLRSVPSVTPPPVHVEPPVVVSATTGESTLGRRHFFTEGGAKVPDFRGMTLRDVLEESAATGLLVEVQGSGMARAQEPPPGFVLQPRTRVRVQFGR